MRPMIKIVSFCLVGWLALPAAPAMAQVVTVLHTFTGGATDGQGPSGSLLLSGSTLFGMTPTGGTGGDGTIFQIGTNGGGFNVIHSFISGINDGRGPDGSLIQSGTTFYGTTEAGGGTNSGTIFQIGTNGNNFNLLHRFSGSDGTLPLCSLIQSGTTFYGTTNSGGSTNQWTVFKVWTDGNGFSVLHNMGSTINDGQQPSYGSLVLSGSALYGMTAGGGSAGFGTIYKVNTDGTGSATSHSFMGGPADGFGPPGSLTLVGSKLYGTAYRGGAADSGIIFDINTDGTGFQVMHSFFGGPGDGANPVGGLLAVGSTLYGTTGRGGADALGTLFGIGLDGTGYNVMHSFAGGPGDGAAPQGDLILAGSALYGMTTVGGSSNLGVIYSIPIAVPEPSSLLLLAAAGGSLAIWVRRRTRKNSPACQILSKSPSSVQEHR